MKKKTHSFSFVAKGDSDAILALAKNSIGNKSELVNRLLVLYGRQMLAAIMAERNLILNPGLNRSEPHARKDEKEK